MEIYYSYVGTPKLIVLDVGRWLQSLRFYYFEQVVLEVYPKCCFVNLCSALVYSIFTATRFGCCDVLLDISYRVQRWR